MVIDSKQFTTAFTDNPNIHRWFQSLNSKIKSNFCLPRRPFSFANNEIQVCFFFLCERNAIRVKFAWQRVDIFGQNILENVNICYAKSNLKWHLIDHQVNGKRVKWIIMMWIVLACFKNEKLVWNRFAHTRTFFSDILASL